MDDATKAWLLAQLGPATDPADLQARYQRLHSARAVALEVLAERRARLLTDPLRLVVDGVVTMDNTANLGGIERHLAQLQDVLGPDEAGPGDDGLPHLVTGYLRPARRIR
ncbi:hypothetical protein ACFYUY_04440 [Kitasatospora sp. NPDC004745]|uniref:hypothetical protein n=1 Tax=Kitasatospora sp. NPDC004745 TaxID=3364019 RepID=UPI0036B2FE8D